MQIDNGSLNSLSHQIIFIVLGYVGAFVGNVDLQATSWIIAISIGIDTIAGSPVQTTMKRFWKKLLKW